MTGSLRAAIFVLSLVGGCGQPPPAPVIHPSPPGGVTPAPSPPGRALSLAKRSRCGAPPTEALEAADRVTAEAKAYFEVDHYDKDGNLWPRRFPAYPDLTTQAGAGALVRTGWTPRTPCCDHAGKQCPGDPAPWQTPAWRALHFQLGDPHAIQVWYESQGTNLEATFTVRVRLDPGCHGEPCVYTRIGTVDAQYEVVTTELKPER